MFFFFNQFLKFQSFSLLEKYHNLIFFMLILIKKSNINLKKRKFHNFSLNFKSFYSILNQDPNMKKGFSQFSSMNFGAENSQNNNQSQQNHNASQKVDMNNLEKLNLPQKKQTPSNGFSAIKKESNGSIRLTEHNNNQGSLENDIFPLNSQMQEGTNNNMMSNGNFGHYPTMNMENPQLFQSNMNSFGENPYAMLFNQFQNNSSSFTGNQSSSQAMIMTLFQIIENQAKSLQSLYGKVEKMTTKINEFGLKMRQMKKNKKQKTFQEQEVKPIIEHIGQTMENIDSKTLIRILFGSNRVYNYKLELNQTLQLPLYRERNFSIQIKLTDQNGKLVKNNNKIPLSLAIYSSQNPPKFIQKNTAGQKILKGYIEQSLHHGQCRFQKIQIKEVTSHFRNGWVFIVIIPCMTPLGSANPNDNFIDYLTIQPLVLEKVIVKAKKIKETNKKGKQQKDESEMGQPRDSQIPMTTQKVQSKQKNTNGHNKPKQQSNPSQSEDIFEDK